MNKVNYCIVYIVDIQVHRKNKAVSLRALRMHGK